MQDILFHEVQGDQQASQTTIPIQQWVNRFELVVCDGNSDKMRDIDGLIVQEFFQIAHEIGNLPLPVVY